MTLEQILEVDREFASQSRAMRSLVISSSPSQQQICLDWPQLSDDCCGAPHASWECLEKDCLLEDWTDPSDAYGVSHHSLSPASSRSSGASSLDTLGFEVKNWYLRQLSCSILETLTEAICRRVWVDQLDLDPVEASRMTFGRLQACNKTPEQERRWNQVEALLVSFERGRDSKLLESAIDIVDSPNIEHFERLNHDGDDTAMAIEGWDVLRSALYNSRPPPLNTLKQAILRSNDESKAFSTASMPDLNDIGRDLFHLSTCSSAAAFLDLASHAMFIFEQIVQELVKLGSRHSNKRSLCSNI